MLSVFFLGQKHTHATDMHVKVPNQGGNRTVYVYVTILGHLNKLNCKGNYNTGTNHVNTNTWC
jgi:hypothetical protein